MSVWVTPTILAGSEDSTTNIVTTRCETAEQAIAVIKGGGTAWIPLDPWDEVALDTMVGLGLSPAWARRQIHAARTGVLLPEEDFA